MITASRQVIIPGKPIPYDRVRGTRKRYHKPEYVAWKELAQGLMLAAWGREIWESVIVEVEFYGAHRGSDPDNLLKSCLDSLVGIAIEDDNWPRAPSGRWECFDGEPKTVIRLHRREL